MAEDENGDYREPTLEEWREYGEGAMKRHRAKERVTFDIVHNYYTMDWFSHKTIEYDTDKYCAPKLECRLGTWYLCATKLHDLMTRTFIGQDWCLNSIHTAVDIFLKIPAQIVGVRSYHQNEGDIAAFWHEVFKKMQSSGCEGCSGIEVDVRAGKPRGVKCTKCPAGVDNSK